MLLAGSTEPTPSLFLPRHDPSDVSLLLETADRKICSNLFLQQLIYYTFFGNFAWLIFIAVRTAQKASTALQTSVK